MKIKMVENGKVIREEDVKQRNPNLVIAKQMNHAKVERPKKGKGSYCRAKEKRFDY